MLVLAVIGCIALATFGVREHRAAMRRRHRLLDEARPLFVQSSHTLSADEHPVIRGLLFNGSRVTLDLVTDTMVTRRLPQLWLRVTLHLDRPGDWPAIGILARPTGSEYYSVVHGLMDWLEPEGASVSVLLRGDPEARGERWRGMRQALTSLVTDPAIKEAVITPGAIRVVLQAAEGERGAHVLLRQARFAVDTVPEATIREGLDLAARLHSLATATAETRATEMA